MSSPHPLKGKKILIIHYRTGRTDGVSLEIAAWAQILSSVGARVESLAGPISSGATYTLKDLEQQLNPSIYALDNLAFKPNLTPVQLDSFKTRFERKQAQLARQFHHVFVKAQPDYLIISNLFSVGENLPAVGALVQTLDAQPIPTLAILHDFYWEAVRYQTPNSPFVRRFLKANLPPRRPFIKLMCINSLGQAALMRRRHLAADLLPDTVDFSQPPWRLDSFNQDLLTRAGFSQNDIIFLQATRIVRRKNIELSIDLVHHLDQPRFLKPLSKTKLARGQRFDPQKNKLVLVLSGYSERRDQRYHQQLLRHAFKQHVTLYPLGSLIHPTRVPPPDKRYSFWDAYPFADMITYPSEYEGFGNQFLEAVFARRPPVVFEYPVFRADIKPLGFAYLSLHHKLIKRQRSDLVSVPPKVLDQAAHQIVDLLTHPPKYRALVKHNFALGKKHFSYANTLTLLTQAFASLDRHPLRST